MPITQDRMLSLLAAGEDYQQALERYWVVAQSTRQRVAAGQITAQQGFDLLAIETRPEWLLKYPYDSPAVLKLEHLHFKRESKRNKRKAEKARENRAAQHAGELPPDRGDGREFGRLGAGRTRLEQDLNIQPDANILLRGTATSLTIEPTVVRVVKNTDGEQVQSDTDLEFGEACPSPEARAAIDKFFAEQDEKERYQEQYGNKPAGADITKL